MKDVSKASTLISKTDNPVIPLRKSGKKAVPGRCSRNAFKMKLKRGFKDEYKRRHDEIWPELNEVLQDAGIMDYSIYLDEETDTLFAFQKLAPGHTANDLPNNRVVRKWWDFMSDIMEYKDDNTPVSIPLEEMFHRDYTFFAKNKKKDGKVVSVEQ